MKLLGVVLVVLVILALSVLLGLVFAGLALGAATAWLLHSPFHVGWRAVWDRKLVALGWAILFLGGAGATSRSTS